MHIECEIFRAAFKLKSRKTTGIFEWKIAEITMHKTLSPRDDVNRLYLKKGEWII